MRVKSAIQFIFAALLIAGCSSNLANTPLQAQREMNGLRTMNQSEAMADFSQLVGYFRTLYGPMQYKEKRFNFNFEDKVAEYSTRVAAAKSDSEIFAVYSEFISMFQDGHVSITFNLNDSGIATYRVPLFITPVDGHVLVGMVGKDLQPTKISVGDEVLMVDGAPPFSYLPKILKYSTMATPESNQHFIARIFGRAFYMTDLVPTKDTVNIRFKKADGTEFTEDLTWRFEKSAAEVVQFVSNKSKGLSYRFDRASIINEQAENSLLSMGQPTPFFATPAVQAMTKWIQVTADEAHRAKFGLKENEKPNIFAAFYRYQGRNILLVRNYIYQHDDFPNHVYMNGYRAILDQWQSMADVLILDQTHNGGGSYCQDFARLFLKKEGPSFVQAMNTDRKWIYDFKSSWRDMLTDGITVNSEIVRAITLMGKVIEDAYDTGQHLTRPLPLMNLRNHVTPDEQFVWTKPMLVLMDELSGSCGDAFPAIIKANGASKLFGRTTMGLGGNVEAFKLEQSQTEVRLTRGLFTTFREDGKYTDTDFVENNGVTPDYEYKHTVEDFRDGYYRYVRAFTQKAVEQIPTN